MIQSWTKNLFEEIIFRIDAIIFTGGIGEKSFIKREKIVDHLKPLGAILDQNSNNTNGAESCGLISTTNSSVEIRVIKTNEELMIARHVTDLFEWSKFCSVWLNLGNVINNFQEFFHCDTETNVVILLLKH